MTTYPDEISENLEEGEILPEEEDEELPAEDLIEKIIDKEKSDILHGKICETMRIHP